MAPWVAQPALHSILSALLSQLLELLGHEELCEFWSVGEELKELEKQLSEIPSVLSLAQSEILDRPVENWMDNLRELAYDIEDILDEMNTDRLQLEQEASNEAGNYLVRNFHKFLNDIREYSHHVTFSTNLKSKIKNVMIRLDEVAKAAHDLGLKEMRGVSLLPYERIERDTTTSFLDNCSIYGRVKEKENIVELLLAPSDSTQKNYSVIPIVGMGGIGKTTLARLVFEDKRMKDHFELQSWACVSDVFDIAEVTVELIEYVTDEICANMSLEALQCRLQDLVKDKRCLLVLDDVWSMNEWERLEAPFYFCANGSKVIVTTRDSNIVIDSSNVKPFELGYLEDEHCYALFKKKAFQGVDEHMDGNLNNIGEKLVRKCGGVPLAVKVLGATLQGTAEVRWKSILKSEFWQSADGHEDNIFPALRISYHYLPSPLKRCFEYLSLFPTNYQFNKDELARLWIAEGLVEAEEGRLLEDIGMEYYSELQRRSLIENDNKIHDLVHGLACLVSRKFYCRLPKDSISCRDIRSIRHSSLVLKFMEVPDPALLLEAKGLRSIFLFKTYFLSDSLLDSIALCLSNWSLLRVLDLSYLRMSELPSSIGNIKHLRYLNLSGNLMQNLPDSIGSLYNLQSLNLCDCTSLNNLPNNIGNLKSLRYLNLSVTSLLSLPDSICKLHKLNVLNLGGCHRLSHLPEYMGYLQNLTKLLLSSTPISRLPDSICKLFNLQVLNLENCLCLSHLPEDMKNLLNLKELNITKFSDSLVENPGRCELKLPPDFGKLINLESLKEYTVGKESGRGIGEFKDVNKLRGSLVISCLENVASVEEAEEADLKSKKCLEDLTLRWSPVVTKNIDESVASLAVEVLEALEPHPTALISLSLQNYNGERFPKWMPEVSLSLKRLELKHLYRIGSSVVNVQFPSLEVLQIEGCPMVIDVSMAVPKLGELRVDDCQGLTKLSLLLSLQDNDSNHNYSSRIDLPKLEELEMCKCPSLKDVAMAVPKLKKLLVQDCRELNLTLTLQVPYLQQLELVSLPYLTSLCDLRISYTQGMWPLSQFPKLRTLRIEKCNKLRSLAMGGPPPPTLAHLRITNCQKLEYLESLFEVGLQFCHKLESILVGKHPLRPSHDLGIEDILLDHHACFRPALSTLHITGCPNLTSLPKVLHNFTSLTNLFVAYCTQLVSFPEEGLPPMLTDLWIRFCPNLRYLPKDLYSLKSLRKLGIGNCPHLEVGPDDRLPPNLEWLSISGCIKLEQQLQEEDRNDWLDLMERSY